MLFFYNFINKAFTLLLFIILTSNKQQNMNKENPQKYSLQMTTCESILSFARKHHLTESSACRTIYFELLSSGVDCGFNLKSSEQFWNSYRRFKYYHIKNERVDKKF